MRCLAGVAGALVLASCARSFTSQRETVDADDPRVHEPMLDPRQFCPALVRGDLVDAAFAASTHVSRVGGRWMPDHAAEALADWLRAQPCVVRIGSNPCLKSARVIVVRLDDALAPKSSSAQLSVREDGSVEVRWTALEGLADEVCERRH